MLTKFSVLSLIFWSDGSWFPSPDQFFGMVAAAFWWGLAGVIAAIPLFIVVTIAALIFNAMTN